MCIEKHRNLNNQSCCGRKSWAACAQNFAPWQQATIEIMLAISLTIACSRYTYGGVILHAHPVRGESHNQRNTTGEVATVLPLVSPVTSIGVTDNKIIYRLYNPDNYLIWRYETSDYYKKKSTEHVRRHPLCVLSHLMCACKHILMLLNTLKLLMNLSLKKTQI